MPGRRKLPCVAVDPELASELTRAAAKVEEWTEKRNALIVQARGQGTLREVAALGGVSHSAIKKIVDKSATGARPTRAKRARS